MCSSICTSGYYKAFVHLCSPGSHVGTGMSYDLLEPGGGNVEINRMFMEIYI